MPKALLLAAVALPALVSDDVLEPSVRNEVDHAIAMGELALASETNSLPADVFGTNGLSDTGIALKLVSSQGPDGRWRTGTNDTTRLALEILRSL
ncbi:MAG: hypothetical protein K6F50_10430 [Kiritimatiellae bacterium]|nr:hypothetical protein [Kiritimatiellia bacterium]